MLRAAGGGEEALVLWLREGARGGSELEPQRWLEACEGERLTAEETEGDGWTRHYKS
jgi:hypothetical protein